MMLLSACIQMLPISVELAGAWAFISFHNASVAGSQPFTFHLKRPVSNLEKAIHSLPPAIFCAAGEDPPADGEPHQ